MLTNKSQDISPCMQQKYKNRVQSAVFLLCQRALAPLLQNDRGPNATASI